MANNKIYKKNGRLYVKVQTVLGSSEPDNSDVFMFREGDEFSNGVTSYTGQLLNAHDKVIEWELPLPQQFCSYPVEMGDAKEVDDGT